jgi:hydroxyacylglutathione hydrolase
VDIAIVQTSGLGDRSYLISAGNTAVVIDPQRDIDRLLSLADRRGVQITHVLETHIHNDYVTGGLELATVTGAEYVVPEGEDVGYRRRPIGDGEIIDAGPIRLYAMHTPGHTHHHMSYVLTDGASEAVAVFTGGSLLHGSTGRTDLLGEDHTEELGHAQYHSVRKLATELAAEMAVYPTHGFGSFCSASPTTADSSTIGEQRQSNPALTQHEEAYVVTGVRAVGFVCRLPRLAVHLGSTADAHRRK